MADYRGKKQRKKRKRRVMRALKINEISAVDTPAQEGAQMVIMKRQKEPKVVATSMEDVLIKSGIFLTDSVSGHTHLVEAGTGAGGITSYNSGDAEQHSHTHPWILEKDGSITIGEADGHVHQVLMKRVQSKTPAALEVDVRELDSDEDEEDKKDNRKRDNPTKTVGKESHGAEPSAVKRTEGEKNMSEKISRGSDGSHIEALEAKFVEGSCIRRTSLTNNGPTMPPWRTKKKQNTLPRVLMKKKPLPRNWRPRIV